MRKVIALALAVGATGALAANAQAGISLGTANQYSIFALEGGSLSINSATSIIGDIGVGKNVTTLQAQKVPGNGGVFTSTVYVHSTSATSFNNNANFANFLPSGGFQYGPGAVDTKLELANADALAASTFNAGLAVTQSLGVLGDNDSRTIVSTGDLNVITIDSLDFNADSLTFQSRNGFDDTFIVNVLGSFAFSDSAILLTNGTTADHVLFNFPAPEVVNIDINKSGTNFNGTILAPLSSIEYHNPATFNGEIIALNIVLHSDFNINQVPFNPPPGVGDTPEPASLGLLGLGAMGLLVRRRRR